MELPEEQQAASFISSVAPLFAQERTIAADASRSDTARQVDRAEFAAASVLGVHFADGSVYYSAPTDFLRDYVDTSTLRSGDSGALLLPQDLGRAGASRGDAAGTQARVSRYTLATGVETPNLLDRIYVAANVLERRIGGSGDTPDPLRLAMAAGRTLTGGQDPSALAAAAAKMLCRHFENSILQQPSVTASAWMLRWSSAGGWSALDSAKPPLPADKLIQPVLLFLHGTASSTHGSFGKLWDPLRTAGDGVPEDFLQLVGRHAATLALEHRTLTSSPIENAIDAVATLERLPDETRVNLVSHSRGGMVGDLLCLTTLDAQTLPAAQSAFGDEFAGQPDAERLAPLFQGISRLIDRKIRVDRFVRVASPARGTLLADGRTDLFLSLLLRAISLATGPVFAPWVNAVGSLVKALVAARADARALPGLEAMKPNSPLTRALNLHGIVTRDTLRVIAGDRQARGLGGVLTLLSDVFYALHDHDFVVHTRSMFGGFARPASLALSLRVETPDTSHFTYFAHPTTRDAIFAALAGNDTAFQSTAEDEAHTRGLLQVITASRSHWPRRRWIEGLRDQAVSALPVLVVLPGIMGSELGSAVKGTVWLSASALASGNARSLQRDTVPELEATGMLSYAYERFLVEAQRQFRVVAFPYDWRDPIPLSADRLLDLLDEIDAALPGRKPVIHIAAHSMGGLVARWALRHAATPRWEDLRARGGRLVMLGTPNRGSLAPVRAALGQHRICNLVGQLARDVTATDVADWCATWRGLMQMLPANTLAAWSGPLTQPAAWTTLFAAAGRPAGKRPTDATLTQVREFRQALDDDAADFDADERVLYVAGSGLTDQRVLQPVRPGSGVVWEQTEEGDGTVSWESKLPRTWYARAEHGALLDTPEIFQAIFELVADGRTDALSRVPPTRRGDAALAPDTRRRAAALSALVPPSLFDDAEAARWLLGLGGPLRPQSVDPIEVEIVFGSLDYARYPLIVGHFLGDRIVSAEARIDQKLRGQLTSLQALNLYPGALNTSVYVRPNCHDNMAPPFPGAIVVGLGNVSELTPTTLVETIARGILRYAFEHRHRDPFAEPHMPEDLCLSSLLVGSHSNTVTMRDSLRGVLDGVHRAAQVISRTPALRDVARLRKIEIVEMWELRALDAAYALQRLLGRIEWRTRFNWERQLLEQRDGGLAGAPAAHDRDWWQRLIIIGNAVGGMGFTLIAETARVESTRVQSDVASMHGFMESISDGNAQTGCDASSMTNVLFELMLPNDLKTRLASFENTVLVVDDVTSAYPWELMAPPRPADERQEDEVPRPLAVQAGFIRQRLVTDFRRLPALTQGDNVLIVGAPPTDGWQDKGGQPLKFAALPGADAEATLVRQQFLGDSRWKVKCLSGDDARAAGVRTLLLAQPYRVLHLCGHGVVDQWVRDIDIAGQTVALKKTGMVLSDQQLLGADDVEQMSNVPELVFINCCYSAASGAARQGLARDYPALAAGMAMQFIKMGAKAVVAAGWRVDDGAAALFARTFYVEILAGTHFGDAVRIAREAAFAVFGSHNNTWGAYQCYGDPQWSLRRSSNRLARTADLTIFAKGVRAMSYRELAAEVMRVVALAGDQPRAVLITSLDNLVDALLADDLRRNWLKDSTTLRSALGEAYRELGDDAKAAAWLLSSAQSAYSQLQLRQLELLANSLAKIEADAAAAPPTGKRPARQSKKILDWLLAAPWLERRQGTAAPIEPDDAIVHGNALHTALSELQSLHASRLLRMAMATFVAGTAAAQPEVVELLRQATADFGAAWVRKRREGDFKDRTAFCLTNFLLCSAACALLHADGTNTALDGLNALVVLNEAGADVPDTPALWLAQARTALEQAQPLPQPYGFWDYANMISLVVGRQLYEIVGAVEPPEAITALTPVVDPIAPLSSRKSSLLTAALIRWPSPRERDGLQRRFAFLRDMLEMHGGRGDGARVVWVAQDLADFLADALAQMGEDPHCHV